MFQTMPYTLALLAAAAVALLLTVGAAVFRRTRTRSSARNQRRQLRAHQVEHLLRLAAEIAAVALTIETDAAPFASIPALTALQTRARRVRLRADAVLKTQDRLSDLPWFELESQVAAIHADHLRIVDLRAIADREITGWRKHPRKAPGRSVRSTWPFASTLTTSTPLNTSTLDA